MLVVPSTNQNMFDPLLLSAVSIQSSFSSPTFPLDDDKSRAIEGIDSYVLYCSLHSEVSFIALHREDLGLPSVGTFIEGDGCKAMIVIPPSSLLHLESILKRTLALLRCVKDWNDSEMLTSFVLYE